MALIGRIKTPDLIDQTISFSLLLFSLTQVESNPLARGAENITTSVDENNNSEFSIFPNPSERFVNIVFGEEKGYYDGAKFSFLTLLFISISGSKPSRQSNKMNVLFIIADDLNCALGAYGDPIAITPNIDKLAKEGLLFSNTHVQYPLCGPSRVSIMTGLYPDQTKSKKLRSS